ncbi:MAG: 1-(5-phosphoribosyl)-5-[(5-phosphoribosylamino)methylideneamino]imidazole-4-carboxamide isomerase [Nitrospirota bacterium]
MFIIPAIDLKDGKCVRLLQGRKDAVTTYSNNPVATAKKWESCGAKLLHIVDLDGAFTGNPKNLDSIIKVRKAVRASLQVGGGIRGIGNIMKVFSSGVDKIIIGTAAIEDPEFLTYCCNKYPGKILVGIDAKNGMVAIKGWEEVTSLTAKDMAQRLAMIGVAGIIYTDISKDGMLSGPNIEAIKEMVEGVNIPVIASGGVSNMDDIKNLLKIKNLWGVITGKAIYTGTLDLKEAIEITKLSLQN